MISSKSKLGEVNMTLSIFESLRMSAERRAASAGKLAEEVVDLFEDDDLYSLGAYRLIPVSSDEEEE